MRYVVLCCVSLLFFCGIHLSSPSLPQAQTLSGFSQNPHIQKGLDSYNDQRYQDANAAFLQALNWNKTTKPDRITALQYLAFIAIIVEKNDQAQNYFLTLLQVDPSFRIGQANPPKFVNFFNGVLKFYQAQRSVKIENLTPDEVPTNQSLVVKLRVLDALRRMSRLELFYRLENGPRYFRRELQETQPPQPAVQPQTLPPAVQPQSPPPAVQPTPQVPPRTPPPTQPATPTTPQPTVAPKTGTTGTPPTSGTSTPEKAVTPAAQQTPSPQPDAKKETVEKPTPRAKGTSPSTDRFFSHEVPSLLFASQADSTQAYYFEFYAVAYDANKQVVATLGSPEKPVRVKRVYIKEEPKTPKIVGTPVYKTWWFWTITGVAVAGITAAIVIPLVLREIKPNPPGSGEVIITIIR